MSSSYDTTSFSSRNYHLEADCGEFEIAKVLASLGRKRNNEATTATSLEVGRGACESVEGGNYWGSKGKRSSMSKRGKTDLDTELGVVQSVPLPFDLNVDVEEASIDDQDVYEDNECPNTEVKIEEVCESQTPNIVGGTTNCAGRSRQNLTEEEKEARRIRRVLANRESARQTIRRRQAMFEELTRKAADLASENEKLKKSKESAIKFFESLQSTNKNLKDQVSQTLGVKLTSPQGEAQQSVDTRTCSHVLPNWPICQPYSLAQLNQPGVLVSPNMMISSHFHSSPLYSSSWCVVPYPSWFIPVPKTRNCFHRFSSVCIHKEKGCTLVDNEHVASPCSVIPRCHNHASVKLADVRTDVTVEMQPNTVNSSVAENGKDLLVDLGKKNKEATAGAEARKRRRELIKFKNLHYGVSSKRVVG